LIDVPLASCNDPATLSLEALLIAPIATLPFVPIVRLGLSIVFVQAVACPMINASLPHPIPIPQGTVPALVNPK